MELLKSIATFLLIAIITVVFSVLVFTTKCPECGKHNDNDTKYCDTCGHTLKLFCDACGEENEDNAEYCRECGERLG